MASILLINSVIRESAPPNVAPLGLLYIAAVLEQHGHQCDICDLNALRQLNPDREYWLKKYVRHYDYIGLSGLIVTYQEQRSYLDFIMNHYGHFGEPILISGGGLATSVPEFVFRHMPELDLLVIGEGEMTMLEVADGIPWWKIAGIQCNHPFGSLPISGCKPRELIPDLDTLPFPAWDKVPVEEVYLQNPIWGGDAGNSSGIGYQAKRSMNMIVSRGCPYSCNFCCRDLIFGKKYRLRSVSNVIDEIGALKSLYDVDFIGFVDDNTTASRKWVVEFCEGMLEADLRVKWGASARVDAVDPEMLALMKEAGCEWLGLGVESAAPEILKNMNKKADPDTAAHAIQMIKKAGIWANATFIAGYPGETKDTLRKTAKFMRDNDCLNSMFYATPYPGTELYKEALPNILDRYGDEDSYIKSLADATDLRVNLSEMSDMELVWCRQLAMKGDIDVFWVQDHE